MIMYLTQAFGPFVVLLCHALQVAAAAHFPASTTSGSVPTSTNKPPATTLKAQRFGHGHELRVPQSIDRNPANFCGFSAGYTWSCIDTLQVCTFSLLVNDHAYLYCSQVGQISQSVDSVAYDYNSDASGHYTPGAQYCPSTSPKAYTVLFTRAGYTVTDVLCGNSSGTFTWGADTNMLDPDAFRSAQQSLYSATASIPPTTSTQVTTDTTSSQSTSPTTPGSGGGGLSQGATIGIGVGVGVGGLGLLLALGVCLFIRKKKKKNSPSSAPPSYYREPEKIDQPQAPYQQYPPNQYQQPQYQQHYQQSQYQQSQYQQAASPPPQSPQSYSPPAQYPQSPVQGGHIYEK